MKNAATAIETRLIDLFEHLDFQKKTVARSKSYFCFLGCLQDLTTASSTASETPSETSTGAQQLRPNTRSSYAHEQVTVNPKL